MPTLNEQIKAALERRNPGLYAQFRKVYEKNLADALQAKDYKRYLLLHGGHERFPALLKIEHLLSNKDYWQCVDLTWSNIEISAPNQREWLRLFKSPRPQRKFLMSVAESPSAGSDGGSAHNLSWTPKRIREERDLLDVIKRTSAIFC